jgi:hypothetical protein
VCAECRYQPLLLFVAGVSLVLLFITCLNGKCGGNYHQPDVTFRYHPDVAFLGFDKSLILLLFCADISLMLLLFFADISLMLLLFFADISLMLLLFFADISLMLLLFCAYISMMLP